MKERKALVLEATRQAISIRTKAGLKLWEPVSIYDFVQEHDIEVWFTDLPTLEGVYYKGTPPRIIITSLRPAGRRIFTCAHEFGHHVFNHGDTIDEIGSLSKDSPNEFLADCFAGQLLMPKTAVGRAFTDRGWSVETCTPLQAYTIAAWFGVGYTTLIQHMSNMLAILPKKYAATLNKYQPKDIRAEVLGQDITEDLTIVDLQWVDRAIDIQVGDVVHLPANVVIEQVGNYLALECLNADSKATLFRGIKPGLCRLYSLKTDWAAFVRVSRRGFVGRSIYRHMEDLDDE